MKRNGILFPLRRIRFFKIQGIREFAFFIFSFFVFACQDFSDDVAPFQKRCYMPDIIKS